MRGISFAIVLEQANSATPGDIRKCLPKVPAFALRCHPDRAKRRGISLRSWWHRHSGLSAFELPPVARHFRSRALRAAAALFLAAIPAAIFPIATRAASITLPSEARQAMDLI